MPSGVIFEPNNMHVTADSIEYRRPGPNGAPLELAVTFSISDMALPLGEAEQLVNVSLVYSPEVYSGVLTVKPDNAAVVIASPLRIEKASAGTAARSALLTLEGKNFSFVSNTAENTPLTVTVPENPGVTISSSKCQITSSPIPAAICPITVTDSAFLGPTALQVVAGGQTTYTSINIVPSAPNDQIVRFWPPIIENCVISECTRPECDDACRKGCEAQDSCPPQVVVAEMIGTSVDERWDVSTTTPGVVIKKETVPDNDYFVLWLSVDGVVVENQIELAFSDGTRVIRGHLMVQDIAGEAFRTFETPWDKEVNPRQGTKYGDLPLKLQAAAFAPSQASITVAPAPHTGIDVDSPTLQVNQQNVGKLYISNFWPVFEAPTGPSAIQITGYPQTNSVSDIWFRVDPQDDSPAYVITETDTIWLARPTAEIVFRGEKAMTLDAATRIWISDPKIRIENIAYGAVEVDTDDTSRIAPTASLSLRISPSVRAGVKTLYFSNPNGTYAAANIRGLKPEAHLLGAAEPSALYRHDGLGKIRVEVSEDFYNAPVALSIIDNIGVRIERYYTCAVTSNGVTSYYLAISFSLEKTGPGGWTGITVSANGQRYVVPVRIVADDKNANDTARALTASVTPEYIVPGRADVQDLNMEMPAAIWTSASAPQLSSLVSEIYPLAIGVDAQIANVSEVDGSSLRMTADFAHWLEVPGTRDFPGIPVAITASEGALIGFWKIRDEDWPTLENDGVCVNSEDEVMVAAKGGGTTLIEGCGSDNEGQRPSLVRIRGDNTKSERYKRAPLDLLTVPDSFENNGNGTSMLLASAPDGMLFGLFDNAFWIWGNQMDPFTVHIAKMVTESDPLMGDDLCLHPWFGVGDISNIGEVDIYEMPLPVSDCRVAVAVSAHSLGNRWGTAPELDVVLCNATNQCNIDTVEGQGASGDPIIYTSAAELASIRIQSKMGTDGFYTLNVRPAAVIERVGTSTVNHFVELQMEPDTGLDGCSLERLDAQSRDDVLLKTQVLHGTVPGSGRVVVAPVNRTDATVIDDVGITLFGTDEDFKLRLVCNGVTVDRFQAGGVSSVPAIPGPDDGTDENVSSGLSSAFEGTALENLSADCYKRIGNSIDSNRNNRDFVPGGATDCALSP